MCCHNNNKFQDKNLRSQLDFTMNGKRQNKRKDPLDLQVILVRPKSMFGKARLKLTKKLHLILSFVLKEQTENARVNESKSATIHRV